MFWFYINIIPKIQIFIKPEPRPNLNKTTQPKPAAHKARPAKDLGLYIHIPFCKTICAYCAFATFANKTEQFDIYIDTLIQEIEAKSRNLQGRAVKTIYFGGGTPSILEIPLLEKIVTNVHKHFDTSELQAMEIECNPESLTMGKIQAYQKLGITRISVGIQTLNNKSLWKIARPHNDTIVLTALKNLNKDGFTNFGCDLIIGLPYQTPDSFQEELKTLLLYKPTHLSTYFLSPDTQKIQTFSADSPVEDKQIAMYEWADKHLTAAGFIHYEVSNYALPGSESKHNLRYWNRQEYLGLGLSAHSFMNNQVSENQDNFKEYLANPLSPKDQFELEGELATADYIMLALRKKDGINLKSFANNYGTEDLSALFKKADPYIKTNLLTLTGHHLQPTLKGWLILDKITRDLI